MHGFVALRRPPNPELLHPELERAPVEAEARRGVGQEVQGDPADDRVDARAVYLSGVALTVVSHLGFAVFVDGPWGAAAARALAGVGWAGTYMTGLKLLADRVEPVLMSRAVAGHAASIGIAGAISFVFAGTIGRWRSTKHTWGRGRAFRSGGRRR